jgi:hypothetical protein
MLTSWYCRHPYLDALERGSLIFAPFPASDENTSGGQLKTRAKRSTRHADLFAISHGKNISVVSPHAAMNPSYVVSGVQRTVNTEKFLNERALKIPEEQKLRNWRVVSLQTLSEHGFSQMMKEVIFPRFLYVLL